MASRSGPGRSHFTQRPYELPGSELCPFSESRGAHASLTFIPSPEGCCFPELPGLVMGTDSHLFLPRVLCATELIRMLLLKAKETRLKLLYSEKGILWI